MAGESENLRIQIQINQALTERNKILATQSEVLSGQLRTAHEMLKATNPEAYDKISGSVENTRRQLEAAAKAAADLGNNGEAARKAQEEAAKAAEKARAEYEAGKKQLEAMAKAAGEFSSGFGKGVKSGVAQVNSLTSAIGGVISGLFNIGMAILAIPFKIFDIITNKAAELASQMSAIAQALEDVREQFGDLGKATSKEVLQASDSMDKGLQQVGLSTSRVFGMGPEGTAARIRFAAEMAGGLGAVFNQLGPMAGELGDRFILLSKGLGLAGEDLKGIVRASLALGEKPKEAMDKFAKEAMLMRDVTGISEKQIAKDMASMTSSSGKFGRLTSKEIAKASASMRTFGLEIKEVEGLMDAFGEFETAAQNAAKLQMVFGANVDYMKLMKSENPAEQFEYLRKQILATGRDIATADRHTVKYLASVTNMDENLVRSAFSAKNAGKSIDEIRKEQEKSGKTQKTQQELFEDLNKSIKRVIESLQHSGSFLDEFLTGFAEGVFRSGPMRDVLYDIAKALVQVRMFGREVGRMFVEMFPGVKEMLGALADFFSPANFQKNIADVRKSLQQFFEDLRKDPKKAFETLYKSVKEKFLDVFDPKSQASTKFFAGAKDFMKTVGGILAAGVGILIKELANGLKEMATFIRNPEEAMKAAGEAGAGIFGELTLVLKESLPVLGDAMMELFNSVWDKYGDKIMTVFAGMVAFIIGKGIVVGIAQALGGALVQGGIVAIKALMLKVVGAGAATQAAAAASGGGAAAMTTISKSFTTIGSTMRNFSTSIQAAAKHAWASVRSVGSFAAAITLMAAFFIPLAAILGVIGFLLIPAIPAVLALSLFVFALNPLMMSFKGLTKANVANAQMMMGSVAGFMLQLTLTFLTATILFIGAISLFSMDSLIKAMMGTVVLGTLVASVAALILVMSSVGQAAQGAPAAMAAMPQLALFMAVAGVLLVPITGLFVLAMSSFTPADMMTALLGVGVLIGIVTAIAGLTIAAAFAGSIVTGPQGALALAGFAAIGLISLAVILYAEFALPRLIKALSVDANWANVYMGLGVLVVLVGAIAGLTYVAALTGAMMAAAGPMALLGLATMGLISLAVAAFVGFALPPLIKEFNGIDLKTAMVAAIAIGSVLGAIAVVAIAAAALGLVIIGTMGLGAVAILAGLAMMATIAGGIKEHVPPIIKAMLEATKNVGTSDDTLKRAEAVAKILGGISGLFAPVASMAQIAESQSGFFSKADPDKLAMMTDKLQGMITGVASKASEIVTGLLGLLKSIPPERIPAIEAGAKVIGAFAQIISSAAGGFSNIKMDKDVIDKLGQGGLTALITAQATAIQDVMKSAGGQIQQLISTVNDAAKSLTPEQVKSLPAQLDVIVKIIDIIAKFSGAMSQMAGTQASTLENVEKAKALNQPIQEFLDPMGALIKKLTGFLKGSEFSELSGAIKTAVQSVPDAKAIESVSKVIDLISTQGAKFIDATIAYKDKAVDENGVKNLKGAMTSLKASMSGVDGIAAIISSTPIANLKQVGNLEKSIIAIGNLASTYYATVAGAVASRNTFSLKSLFIDLKGAAADITSDSMKSLEAMGKTLQPFSMYGKNVADTVTSLATAYETNAFVNAVEAVKKMKEIHDLLNDPNIVDLDVTLDNVAKKLEISKENLKIENKPINVTVNLNMTIDAERFTNTMMTTAADMLNGKTSVKLSSDAKTMLLR